MKKSPTIEPMHSQSAHGYQGFPQDHLANFTSVAGYLIPVYWDWLDPGDKISAKTLLRTVTQPMSAPAMATCIERIEWFAVPIDQLYKPFRPKYTGVNDVETDLLPSNGYSEDLPIIPMDVLNTFVGSRPTGFISQSGAPVELPTLEETKRLCDALGCSKQVGKDPDKLMVGSVDALPFAAYQKIYYDHYRLTDREENDPEAYNLDSFSGTIGHGTDIRVESRLNKLLQLRKRPYMRDYFTSMQVSPLMGSQDVNASGTDLGRVNQWLSGLNSVKTAVPTSSSTILSGSGALANNNTTPSSVMLPNPTSSGTAANANYGQLNPANIRSMFAVEKLLEVTRRAKKHYDSQMLAHFGVDVPSGLSGECLKLGTHEQFLKIGEVLSTANTQEGSLGERAGVGSSEGQSEKVSFEAKCHCILMAIYSVEPVVNLINDGVDRRLTMTKASDFYKSEFDNLGLQPVFRFELKQQLYENSASVSSNTENSVIGWQSRYQQLKARYNRSFGGVASAFFQEWSLNRTPIADGASNLSRNFFYVWPTDMNNILVDPYSGSIDYGAAYSEDYFINQIYFDITKSSKKSIYGVPNL